MEPGANAPLSDPAGTAGYAKSYASTAVFCQLEGLDRKIRRYARRVTFRFIHAADLHLDSPFIGIRETVPEVAEILRRATFEAYDRIIGLCIERRVDALLVAGDVFDSADRSLAAQIHFVRGLERLNQADIRAFICHGNHDPLDGGVDNLTMPPNTHQFGPTVEAVPIDVSSSASPVVCGVSYPTRDVRTSLLPGFPEPLAGRFTIGLLHANVGSNTGHEAYAPCTVEELAATGYDYWALGHVHNRAIVHEAPLIVYPGNAQGRHFKERGPRGIYVVEVDDFSSASPEFVAVDTVRWEELTVQIEGVEDDTSLFNLIDDAVSSLLNDADGRHLVYRVELRGRGPVHSSLIRKGSVEGLIGQLNDVWLSRRPFAFCGALVDKTGTAIDRESLVSGSDFVSDFLTLVEDATENEELMRELRQELAPLYDSARARTYLDEVRPGSDEVRNLLKAAEDVVLDLLVDDSVRTKS